MIYTGQVIEIVLDTNTDLSGATDTKIRYERPDKVIGEWSATRVGNTLTYTTSENDLSVAGTWKMQAQVNQSGRRLGTIVRMEVDRRI